jgi:hypothetical protein
MTGIPDDPDSEPWDLLLQNIAQGSVVPVIGRDLLEVAPGVTLYSELATRLAAALRLPADAVAADPASPLNAVAARHIISGGEVDDIYRGLARIMIQMPAPPIPEALRKLAQITQFSLFVTTTFDDLIANAIADERGDPPRVLNFSNRTAGDDYTRAPGTTVYHIMGRVSGLQDYVVTEEDALESVFALQSPRQPTQLLHELAQRSLLIVGCSFPSWAVRFFLRLTRGRRLLFADREKVAFIVDPGASADAGLLQFLNTFKTRTEVFAHHGASDFVDALHTRWLALNPAAPPADVMPFGSVFVSYASEDRVRVEPIVRALQAHDLPVWFDREQLEPGDGWDAKIRWNLDQASAFVPILSDTAIKQTERYFFAEWNQSVERSRRFARGTRFIFPVAIDAVDPNNPVIPDEFRAVQFTPVSGGEVPEPLITNLTAAVKRMKQDIRR